jgi:hypothetical protein
LQHILAILALLLFYLAWQFILEPLVRYCYSPPHGSLVLAFTWVVGLAAFPLGLSIRESHPASGAALIMLGVPIALLATLIFRDQRREAQGLGPVTANIPWRISSPTRMVLFLLAIGSAALAVAVLSPVNRDWWGGLSLALLSVGLGRLAWTGRLTRELRQSLGADD